MITLTDEQREQIESAVNTARGRWLEVIAKEKLGFEFRPFDFVDEELSKIDAKKASET